MPYPPNSGGTIKSWNYVKHLAEKNKLTVACLLKEGDKENVLEFEQKIHLLDFFGVELLIPRSALTLLKSYLFSSCLNAFRNYSKSFEKIVYQHAKGYEIIIVDHYEMYQYVPKEFRGTVVMHTHNAEFALWKRMGELTSNPIKKILLAIESWRVKKLERKIAKEAKLVYATPSDIELYAQEGFITNAFYTTFHLGNDQLLDLPDLEFETSEKALLFMGTLSWEPNIDGLCWFIEKVWPILKHADPEIKLFVLGKEPDKRILKAAGKDHTIEFPGFIKDLETYLKKTRVYIAPLRFGSGMKVKVLEGLYRGVPTVSTSVGAEGLLVKHQENIMIADTVEDFANSCLQLLKNKDLWDKLKVDSRKLATEHYQWKKLFESMDKNLDLVLSKNT